MNGFKENIREALLDDIEDNFVDEWAEVAIRESHEVLDQAATGLDYDVESIKESLRGPEVVRDRNSVTIRYGWDHEAAAYFEFGTSPHTIEGDPVLSFVWEDAPEGIQEEFGDGDGGDPRVFLPEVEHPGTPALRFIRQGLESLRLEVFA